MKMNQIILQTTSIDAARDFYQTLGFQLIVDTPEYLRFASIDGDTSFSLALADSASQGAAVYFELPYLDQWVADLQAKGIVFEQMPTDKPYLWREATLYDPAGNKIVLYWAGDNRLNPPWRVKAIKEEENKAAV